MSTHMKTITVEALLDVQQGTLILPVLPDANAPPKPETGAIRWNAKLRMLQVFDGTWLTIGKGIAPIRASKPEQDE
jgi:hypothetical protein